MPDFDNKPDFQDAINTLSAKQGGSAETFKADDPELAAKMAAAQQNMASQSAQAAQAYQKTQNLSEGARSASFNANGDPSNPEDNVSTADTEQEISSELYDDDVDVETLLEENQSLQEEVATLKGQMDVLKQTVASEHDKMLRAVAEADNVRKRAAQEVERERKFALEKFVRSLLPIYDALEKALEFSDRNNEATKATIDGVENTLNLFLKELTSFGVELVDPTGQAFDPNFHQAVSMVPSAEVPNNHVLNTMQKGFLLNGRVVRPAMVIVAKQ